MNKPRSDFKTLILVNQNCEATEVNWRQRKYRLETLKRQRRQAKLDRRRRRRTG